MSIIFRVSVALAIARSVRVDDDAGVAVLPHHHHHPQGQHVKEAVSKAKDDREEQVVKQASDVQVAFTAAHKLTSKKAKVAVDADNEAKAAAKEANIHAQKMTKQMQETKKVYDKAAKIEKIAIADRHKKEEGYAKAWAKADEAELKHEAAHREKESSAATAAKAHKVMEKAHAAKVAADKTRKEQVRIANEHSSHSAALHHQAKAIQKKAIQLVKHKVVTEKIATDAVIKKTKADAAKKVANDHAKAAAAEHLDAEKSAEEAVVANRQARDVSNLKTGLAFRALQDKVHSDTEAEQHSHVDGVMRSSVAAVNNQIARDDAADDEPQADSNETEADATTAAPDA